MHSHSDTTLINFVTQAHVRRKMSKEERLALVKAGREDRGPYMARTAVKQKKVNLQAVNVCFVATTWLFNSYFSV